MKRSEQDVKDEFGTLQWGHRTLILIENDMVENHPESVGTAVDPDHLEDLGCWLDMYENLRSPSLLTNHHRDAMQQLFDIMAESQHAPMDDTKTRNRIRHMTLEVRESFDWGTDWHPEEFLLVYYWSQQPA